jgi:hypothetical protein
MEFEIKAGGKLDLLTKAEAREAFTEAMVELYRGVRFVTRAAQGTVTGAGALSIVDETFGPESGFVWSVSRVSALLTTNQTVTLSKNEAAPSNFVGLVLASPGFAVFDSRALVLNPLEKLVITGTGLTAAQVVAVTIAAVEIPQQLAWQLI